MKLKNKKIYRQNWNGIFIWLIIDNEYTTVSTSTLSVDWKGKEVEHMCDFNMHFHSINVVYRGLYPFELQSIIIRPKACLS